MREPKSSVGRASKGGKARARNARSRPVTTEQLDRDIERYGRELRPEYGRLAAEVEDLISKILKRRKIAHHSVTSRGKSTESLREKIEREGKHYRDPLRQVTDLAGVRVVTYFPSQVDDVVSALRSEFAVNDELSVDKRRSTDPKIFGYASVHLIADLGPERLALGENRDFTDMLFEVQVRTILQHAWAEIEHDIVYKATEDIPPELQRRFACLAGLLELADKEFESIRQDEVRIRATIEDTIRDDRMDIPLNLDSVQVYFSRVHSWDILQSGKASNLVKLCRDAGLLTVADLHASLSPEALAAAESQMQQDGIRCPMVDDCNLRFFVAVGNYGGLSMASIGAASQCPELEQKGGRPTGGQSPSARGRRTSATNAPGADGSSQKRPKRSAAPPKKAGRRESSE